MARAKWLVAQTRTQCAADVRRRDRQIESLKKQMGETQRTRGSGKNSAVTVITVTGDVGAEPAAAAAGSSPASGLGSTASEGYDLRSETNEFLTQLARNLSEENEKLLALFTKARDELKAMSGWAGDAAGETGGDGYVVNLVANVDGIAADLDAILEHLRTILTNPSFVPLEEVVVREEEISRLRSGWVQMETRWKEAVHLIEGWRRRMASNGRPVNEEELKMGLRLSPVRVKDVEETANGMDLRLSAVQEEPEEESRLAVLSSPSPAESLHLVPAPPEYDVLDSDFEASDDEDGLEIEELEAEEPNVQVLGQSMAAVDSSPLPEPPRLRPLKDSKSAGNRRPANETRPRKRHGDFTTIVEENSRELPAESNVIVVEKTRREPSPKRRQKPLPVSPVVEEDRKAPSPVPLDASSSSLESLLLVKPVNHVTSTRPRPRPTQKKPPPNPAKQAAPTITKVNSSTNSTKSVESAPRSSGPASKSKNPTPKNPTPPRPQSPVVATQQQEESSKQAIATPGNSSPTRRGGNSRLPLPRPANPPPQASPLTMDAIAAKLAASEREADAARVRAKLKAARMGSRRKPSLAPPPGVDEEDELAGEPYEVDPIKKDLPLTESRGDDDAPAEEPPGASDDEKPVMRKRQRRVSKVANRRRSTLSPWELESLISGNVVATPIK